MEPLGVLPQLARRAVVDDPPVLDHIRALGVLLIEQFVHVALALAERAYVIENGRIVHHGTARELREHPERLHSAYLLRERRDAAELLEESE